MKNKVTNLPLAKLDIVVSVVFVIIGAILIIEGFDYSQDAYLFPVVVLGGGLIVSAIQGGVGLWQCRKKPSEDHQYPFEDYPFLEVAIILLGLLVYLLLIQHVGFFFCTWCFLMGVLTYLRKEYFLSNLIIVSMVTVGVWLLFAELLKVPLPRGIFI